MIVVDLPTDPGTIKIITANGDIVTESASVLDDLELGQSDVECDIKDKPYYDVCTSMKSCGLCSASPHCGSSFFISLFHRLG